MRVLDAGTTTLSNADVLDWVRRKRQLHIQEDAALNGADAPIKRPLAFSRMLKRMEREFSLADYPYAKNPSVYTGEKRDEVLQAFTVAVDDALQDSLENEWRERSKTKSAAEHNAMYTHEQDKKSLTPSELLQVYNLAPNCVEMLEPMLADADARFTRDGLQLIVDLVLQHLRPDEH